METQQKLSELAKKLTIASTFGAALPYELQDKWQQEANGYRCTLKYQGRRYFFDYWMGQAHTDEPTVDGVLDCLLSDAQGGEQSFEDFCSEFGYDTDSRKAENIWKACTITTKRMKHLLGADYETFLASDRDI